MSVVIEVTPITFEGTGFMEHISRLKICYSDIAYTIKRKLNAPSSFTKFGVFQ